jgi:hypothetical protein
MNVLKTALRSFEQSESKQGYHEREDRSEQRRSARGRAGHDNNGRNDLADNN